MERLQPFLPGFSPTESPANLGLLRVVEENNNYLLNITAEGVRKAIPVYKGMNTAKYGPTITTSIRKNKGETIYFHLVATRESALYQNGAWRDLVVSFEDEDNDEEEGDEQVKGVIVYAYIPRLPMLLEGRKLTTKYDDTHNLWLTRDPLDISS